MTGTKRGQWVVFETRRTFQVTEYTPFPSARNRRTERWRPGGSIMLGRAHPVKPQPGPTSAFWTLRGLWLDRAAGRADPPLHGKHLPSGEDGLPGETEPDRTRPGPTRTTIRCGEAPALDAIPEPAHAVFVAYQTTGFLGGLNLPVHGGAPPFGRGNRHWRKMRPVGSIMTW